jgi:hypothetical protein
VYWYQGEFSVISSCYTTSVAITAQLISTFRTDSVANLCQDFLSYCTCITYVAPAYNVMLLNKKVVLLRYMQRIATSTHLKINFNIFLNYIFSLYFYGMHIISYPAGERSAVCQEVWGEQVASPGLFPPEVP